MKAKRKLVEIDPAHHKKLSAVRGELKKKGSVVLSMPALVRLAIEYGLPSVEKSLLGSSGV